ncbi:MAG: alanine racemase [Candidatus Lloydbacteria bacterium RIFCSPHIGHO2_01_FULL_49_22]|uniref:Alanine racemase n=1 Tax=Candidatus Lloydbacteria bacterium RIFCSPHIGHO2_01_FULL_49_22 TaxID=1798658 RepID=A0A1G2CV48_9BACT|nr:MAG: alanine racemase [Candidatus Lloydbacteria bacterium RIFCSPHIGHO2_01_FULL_49_22]OGZ10378.1 MAG: alanine racemase [Candidatus Lloydbacteria bacterium RIFCSPHIGHO2_02_FULL_50_18]
MKYAENLRTWIEVDKRAIAKNYRTFRKLIGKKTMMMAVVKSNAYGHNLHEFAPEMVRLGADWLGVDSITEAMALRKNGINVPILVLGFTLPSLYRDARKHNISITISSFAQFKEVCKLPPSKKPLLVHIKVDTGMHRQGFQMEEALKLLREIAQTPLRIFRVEGLYTHFAEAKNPRNSDATKRQAAEFEKWKVLFYEAGHDPICHAAATGGAMLYPNTHYDMVRIGIGCYGLWPSDEAKYHLSRSIALYPVLAWKAVVGEVKEVKKGERVGYDSTEMLRRDSRLAVIPVGYWHGIPRMLSSKGRVLIGGKSAGIVGRVAMDMIVVDVTDIPNVRMGDEVVLIGKQGKELIESSEMAQFAATTHYEVVTRLNPLIKRFYVI